LLDIGEEQVVDEQKELIWWTIGANFGPPSNKMPGQVKE